MADTKSTSAGSIEVHDSQHTHPKLKKPFSIHGRLGGAFNVEGEGFGEGGTLLVGGRYLEATAWGDTLIKGQFPRDLVPGPVSVNGKVIGQYPMPPKPDVPPPAAVVTASGVAAK